MEIKKYVLMSNGQIHDVSKGYLMGNSSLYGGWEEDRGAYNGHHIEIGEDYPIENETLKGFIIKTSNNILALATENDMIEYVRKSGKIDRYFIFNIEVLDLGNGEIQDRHAIHGGISDINIKTYLYKKQSNGDYKRYEVEE